MKMGQVAQFLEDARVVVVVRRLPEEVFADVIRALIDGGIQALEITMDAKGAAGLIRQVRDAYGDRATIGAGTVLTEGQLKEAVEAGAEFLVGPHFDPALLSLANERGLPLIPGVLTPSEIQSARLAGAEALKIFPAGTMGPGYIKDLLGPFHDLQAMVTGGITEDNAPEFIRAGAKAVGMGSSLFPKDEIANRDYAAISRRVDRVLASLASLGD
ncbi:bifunctional 4-hydroxy-2-oxoglutarate aldolase/2-dehydro-3-deoxy-phosphogluconate aldolase [Alicyclobacillus acidiphilus]|uniref:bifunctional 4-hydroxy-2-oxoglutarate aldolase/2-dehydro-3-deoxy-phosphogluconate aldolase n=1 Tax=Alicyclobacillus acidiphilus TaxID=182455 RepID=UPI0008314E5C|nr:bifunctional 4-hydroxy-2-oxoglutarate aldolase/2-dehydro-3-deoxy-phosphogluconate aldolase [Alicyclobacillus acidiphilus]